MLYAVVILSTLFVFALVYIFEQKKVHAAALKVHADALAAEKKTSDFWYRASNEVGALHNRVSQELFDLKLKIEADAAKLAVKSKIKKAKA